MFEEIKNRIAHLTQTKKEIQDLYLLSDNEIEQTGLSERNMQISMELSFLNKLLQYDVSDWHLFSDELPNDNEEILVRKGIGKEVKRSKWKYSIYLNDLKKGMEWKRWTDACR